MISQCLPSGDLLPTANTNNTGTGSLSWSNPLNILTSNNSYASCGSLLGILASAQTNYMYTTAYGFAVPLTATVCGIEVRVERNAAGLLIGSSVNDKNVFMMKAGAPIGTNHASGSNWSGSDAVAVYGNNADLWGTTWTPAEINAGNFGMALSAQLNAGLASLFLTANVDMTSIKVYYEISTLPVELVSFIGKPQNETVKLEWQTASEKNNRYFDLEKMNDDYSWTALERVAGNGNSLSTLSYQSYDKNPSEINYYRLKQVDYNFKFTYSPVISVEYTLSRDATIRMYPVPATTHLTIATPYHVKKIEVIADDGSVIVPEIEQEDPVKINTAALSPGIYILKLNGDSENSIKKFIKE